MYHYPNPFLVCGLHIVFHICIYRLTPLGLLWETKLMAHSSLKLISLVFAKIMHTQRSLPMKHTRGTQKSKNG